MGKRIVVFYIFLICAASVLCSQSLPPVFADKQIEERDTPLTTKYLSPTKVMWTSGENVMNADKLLKKGVGQADLTSGTYTRITNGGGIILDFGVEIQGGIQIVTSISNKNPAGRIRIRFGESIGEVSSDIKQNGATNDHAIRDMEVVLPWLGVAEFGNTGFRFVSIDLLDEETTLEIKEISARFSYRDIPYLGSFECNDEKINRIWMTGAYTVHLNMQEYLWDGIKRDRLVWVGDLHPEVMTVNTVFGYNDVVPKSLDYIRDLTPLPNWMNGISSYSMWWLLIHSDWYRYHGDLGYLKQQKKYIGELLRHLSTKIDDSGKEILDGNRFLDWPSSENPKAIHAGLQAMMVMTFKAGKELSVILNDKETETLCDNTLTKLAQYKIALTGSKQADALLVLSGLISPERVNEEVLSKNGVRGMSTFYGYYMLNARAEAEDIQGGLDNIKKYWGAMLDLGATTFWEDFNIGWMENASRIDQLLTAGKIDVHAAYGAYCYEGYRHSLCHGWASGPTTWLSRYVLGVEPLDAGCKTVRIKPELGDLEWVKGTFPTPKGVIEIEHKKDKTGKIVSKIKAPKGVKIVK